MNLTENSYTTCSIIANKRIGSHLNMNVIYIMIFKRIPDTIIFFSLRDTV